MVTTLYSRGWFGSRRVLIEENCLGFYEHQFGSDRVRRTLFDRLGSVVVWRRFPWDKAAVYSLILGLPGLSLTASGLYMNEPGMWIIGGGLLLFWALIFARYLRYGRSTLLVYRDGKARRIQVIVSPKKLSRFLDTLDQAVLLYQSTHRKDEPITQPKLPALSESQAELNEPHS